MLALKLDPELVDLVLQLVGVLDRHNLVPLCGLEMCLGLTELGLNCRCSNSTCSGAIYAV